jgi:hypothetical protein
MPSVKMGVLVRNFRDTAVEHGRLKSFVSNCDSWHAYMSRGIVDGVLE